MNKLEKQIMVTVFSQRLKELRQGILKLNMAISATGASAVKNNVGNKLTAKPQKIQHFTDKELADIGSL